ncbi:hypothetical protein [Streptomyces sp. OE57]|uniref:hypothetical protein n=1 Tax=Streptomyces lacaronensis TaxID=3379885 RepID=UPI0039B770D0
MPKSTDQTRSGASDGAESVDRAAVAAVLAAMAAHFTANRPDELLTPDALAVCASAEVYIHTGRSVLGGAAPLLSAVVDALPESEPAATRRQYADRLREEAAAYGWIEDETERAIPTVPAARPAPKPAAPARRPGVPGQRPSAGRSGR